MHEDPANARLHGEKNLTAIRGSLAHFGQVETLVVQKSTGKVIGGNGRLKVMRELGWTEARICEVDCDNVTATSLGIALNRTAELAEWDDEVLGRLLQDVAIGDAELQQMMSDLANDVGLFDVSEVDPPELPDGDREPFRQVTFTLHDSQHETIEAALKKAKAAGGDESDVNENSNGNAIASICEAYLNG